MSTRQSFSGFDKTQKALHMETPTKSSVPKRKKRKVNTSKYEIDRQSLLERVRKLEGHKVRIIIAYYHDFNTTKRYRAERQSRNLPCADILIVWLGLKGRGWEAV